MPYVLKSEVFIRGETGEEGEELGPLFLNFQDPPLASTQYRKNNGSTLKFELR